MKDEKQEELTSDQALVNKVRDEIQALLKTNGVEIIPTLKYTDMGIFPEIKIVKVPQHETTEETIIPVKE